MNYLQITDLAAKHHATQEEIGMEGFADFLDFVGSVRDSIAEVVRSVFNEEFKSVDVAPKPFHEVQNLMKQKNVDYTTISAISVYRPEAMTEPMSDFSQELYEQFKVMATLEDRLYAPATKWFARAAASHDYAEKIWVDKDLLSVDVGKLQKAMRAFYKKDRSDSTDMETVARLYGSIRQMEKAYEFLYKLSQEGSKFSLSRLKDAEEKLTMYISEMIEAEEQSRNTDKPYEIPKGTKQRIAGVLESIRVETEYMAAVTTLATQTIVAWNDSMDKLILDINEL